MNGCHIHKAWQWQVQVKPTVFHASEIESFAKTRCLGPLLDLSACNLLELCNKGRVQK